MAQLKGHSNIVNCDDVRYVRQDNGIGWNIYIKMELLTSLPKALRGQVEEAQVIRLGIDICTALELCQSKNIIHRDIKPQNIFISEAGEYKLGDFGIAKTTERTTTGTKTGTYRFMAPEVYNSRPYGAAVDIYSLGLVLYWLLNERRTPFLPLPPTVPTGRMEDEARDRRMKGEAIPEPKNGSEALKAVVLKSVAFEPKERYSDPTEMKRALQALLQPKAAEAPVVEVKEQPETPEAPAAVVEVQPEVPEVPVAEEEDGSQTVFEPRQPEEKTEPPENGTKKKKKKGVPVWLWIVLIGAVLAGVYYWYLTAAPDDIDIPVKEGYTYIGSYSEIIITGYEGEQPANMILPEKINGISVTSIGGSAFFGCRILRSVTIPDSVTSIGSSAFSDCSRLTSVTIPEGVTSIGNSAFSDCSSLTSVTIPNSVTSIGSYAFSDCSSLTSVTIPNSVTDIGNFAFRACSSLTSVTISEGLTSISWGLFYDCSSLTSVTIPDSVTSIGSFAFRSCSSLTDLTIPEGMINISEGAFRGCDSLTSVTIPVNCELGEGAFPETCTVIRR